MNELMAELCAGGPVVTDGAWGTELQARGLPSGECPDAWNLTRSADVEAVARAYVEAGSRVILTNTFGANRIALARHGQAEQAEAINRAGVAISYRAAGEHARVFASIGPSGVAPGSADGLDRAFAEQARALAEAGAEALVVETMSDLVEAVIAVRAARETGRPVVACMSFSAGPEHDRTLAGVTPEQAAEALAAAGAQAIGANCGEGPAAMLPVCRRLRAATALPLWIKPNAGLPQLTEAGYVYSMTPQEFAELGLVLVEAGADFIGGCCGTNPAFICALVGALSVER